MRSRNFCVGTQGQRDYIWPNFAILVILERAYLVFLKNL